MRAAIIHSARGNRVVFKNLDGGQLAEILGALGLGGIGKAFIDLVIARGRARSAEGPAMIKSASEFQEALSEAAKALLADYRNQLGFVREHCERLQAQVDHAAQELIKTRAEHETCRAELAGLRREIAALRAAAATFLNGDDES